jgi:hypothetical protein
MRTEGAAKAKAEADRLLAAKAEAAAKLQQERQRATEAQAAAAAAAAAALASAQGKGTAAASDLAEQEIERARIANEAKAAMLAARKAQKAEERKLRKAEKAKAEFLARQLARMQMEGQGETDARVKRLFGIAVGAGTGGVGGGMTGGGMGNAVGGWQGGAGGPGGGAVGVLGGSPPTSGAGEMTAGGFGGAGGAENASPHTPRPALLTGAERTLPSPAGVRSIPNNPVQSALRPNVQRASTLSSPAGVRPDLNKRTLLSAAETALLASAGAMRAPGDTTLPHTTRVGAAGTIHSSAIHTSGTPVLPFTARERGTAPLLLDAGTARARTARGQPKNNSRGRAGESQSEGGKEDVKEGVRAGGVLPPLPPARHVDTVFSNLRVSIQGAPVLIIDDQSEEEDNETGIAQPGPPPPVRPRLSRPSPRASPPLSHRAGYSFPPAAAPVAIPGTPNPIPGTPTAIPGTRVAIPGTPSLPNAAPALIPGTPRPPPAAPPVAIPGTPRLPPATWTRTPAAAADTGNGVVTTSNLGHVNAATANTTHTGQMGPTNANAGGELRATAGGERSPDRHAAAPGAPSTANKHSPWQPRERVPPADILHSPRPQARGPPTDILVSPRPSGGGPRLPAAPLGWKVQPAYPRAQAQRLPAPPCPPTEIPKAGSPRREAAAAATITAAGGVRASATHGRDPTGFCEWDVGDGVGAWPVSPGSPEEHIGLAWGVGNSSPVSLPGIGPRTARRR